MKIRFVSALVATAALGLSAAGSAQAAVSVAIAPQANNLFGPLSLGQTMLEDFDAVHNANVQYVGTVRPNAGQPFEDPISTSAPPPYTGPGAASTHDGSTPITVDPTKYASVQAGETGTLNVLNGYYLESFSFYMGSPDNYNHINFFDNDGGLVGSLSGVAIWDAATYGGVPGSMGDRSWGYRVYYDFGGAKVTKITFTTETTNAFEFDSLAGNLAPVPEPASWALMIAGFGGVGALLRRRRKPAFA